MVEAKFRSKNGEPRKLPLDIRRDMGFNRSSPYSLGKLVEWKRSQSWYLLNLERYSLLAREIS